MTPFRRRLALLAAGMLIGTPPVAGAIGKAPILASPLTDGELRAIENRLEQHGALAIDRFAARRLDAFASQSADAEVRRDATRAFLTLDLAKTPVAASGLVSLAELLDENGREEDALSVARAALTRGEGALSGWRVGWLERTEVCALSALGRAEEANRLADALKAQAKRNEAATVEGLLCLKRSDEAAALAVATLVTAEGAEAIADQFQPAGALWASSGSRLRPMWTVLRQRADVRGAFDKAARILPERLWPVREPRPIPRVARPDDLPVT